ncbi:MAG TPA: substrate-binding domain-containing protein [Syntrophales bacterium]|nr:substrate-binding domain-containing protein [Syntrophales bacterium]
MARAKRGFLAGIVVALSIVLAFSQAFGESGCTETYRSGSHAFSLATGSPGELGLLKVLGEAFCGKNDAALCWVKAGSGQSLDLLKGKKVDMIMVHAPAAEKKAVEEGWATKRLLIGSNEFYVVGPPGDPAGIASATSAADAYKRIAAKKARFFSRGDNSGTHKKEMAVWKKAGIEPAGGWYVVTKDFMTATLKRANDEKGYFMTDSSTWIAEKKNVPALTILFRGDKFLVNTYHTLCLPPGASPGAATAAKFIDFVSSGEGQEILRSFGKERFDQGLYNDAAYAAKYDD